MPTSRETVPNRALSGEELRQILRSDFDRLLANAGMLSSHMAFGRIGYEVILRLHLDNASHSFDETHLRSHPIASNLLDGQPELASIESPPLAFPSDDATAIAFRRIREIHSPNLERIREGIPVPVEVKQQDGTVTTQSIVYPPSPDLPDDARDDTAAPTAEARVDWSLLDRPIAALDAPDLP